MKKHLKARKILARKTTFNGAFVSALAPFEDFNLAGVEAAIRDLDQDPNTDLECVYCGKPAATWDHLFNLVVAKDASGYGHTIRNLVPSCRSCNERKGGKHWKTFLESRDDVPDRKLRAARIERFAKHSLAKIDIEKLHQAAPDEYKRFQELRVQLFELLEEADRLAEIIRAKYTATIEIADDPQASNDQYAKLGALPQLEEPGASQSAAAASLMPV